MEYGATSCEAAPLGRWFRSSATAVKGGRSPFSSRKWWQDHSHCHSSGDWSRWLLAQPHGPEWQVSRPSRNCNRGLANLSTGGTRPGRVLASVGDELLRQD